MKKLLLFVASCMILNFANGQSTTPAPYCVALGSPGTSFIRGVKVGTLDNNNTVSRGYTFYNNLAAVSLAKGTANAFQFIFSVGGGAGYGVWIDYNHNNTFEDNEKVAGTTTAYLPLGLTTTIDTITQQITIPTTAMTGATRMRVRCVENDEAQSPICPPCQTTMPQQYYAAETEDYTLTITAGTGGGTGIADVTFPAELRMYPNPVTTVLNIINEGKAAYDYNILSSSGASILNGSIKQGENSIQLNNIARGIYYILIRDKEGQTYRKPFVK